MTKIPSTIKLFWKNPYLTESKARIIDIHDSDIILDETIFYPFSGGQESDKGTIGGKEVLFAKINDKNIIYTLENTDDFKVGDEVSTVIDWDRRYKLMKLHFSAEIVLELFLKKFPEIEKIGAHIASDKARVDFKTENNLSDTCVEIEEMTNEMIKNNDIIISDFSDEEDERRYWEIVGFAKIPCCGTHIKTTGEIGQVELKRKTAGAGKERVEIYLK